MEWAFPKEREEKRQFFFDRLEEIGADLELRADEAEEKGTLPQATVDLLYQSGLLHLKLPEVLGGAEADPLTYLDVIEAVCAVDTSAGWCTLINATSIAWPGAFLPDEAVQQIFAEGNVPIAAAVTAPMGRATAMNGGYLINGRWSFASGSRHAQWLLGGCRIVKDGQDLPEQLMMVVPAAQAEIYDNWQVMGLKGTGSCDFSVSEVFVSEAFTWSFGQSLPKRGGPHFLMGRPGFVIVDHAAFALGVARRALDEILELSQVKRKGYLDPATIAASSAFQGDIGQAELQLQAARALVVQILEEAWESCCKGNIPEPFLQAKLRSSAALVTEVAAEVTSLAFRYGGASSVYSSAVLQRCFRDINAAAQHRVVRKSSHENYGQFLLGLPDANPMA